MPNGGGFIFLEADVDEYYIHGKILLVQAGLPAARVKVIIGAFVDGKDIPI